MASKHQGGLGRGFGEFFQSSTALSADPVTDDSNDSLTSVNAAGRGTVARDRSSASIVTEEVVDGSDPRFSSDDSDGDPQASDLAGQEDAVSPVDEDDRGRIQAPTTELVDGSRLQLVPVSKIHPNPRQPRRSFDEEALLELSESIAEVGLLQPIVVRPDDDGYELVMGERRWRATRLAGLEEIPAIVRATDAQDLLRDALLENLHRAQLNPLEEAAAYQQLLDDFGCTQDELAQRIKRSRSQIANMIRLMKLPRSVQRFLLDGSLTAGHARALLGLGDVEEQSKLAEKIVDDGLSVRATEALVKAAGESKTTVKPYVRRKPGSDEEAVQLATRLADVYDTDVTVKRSRGRGKIILAFEDDDDLKRIIGILDRG